MNLLFIEILASVITSRVFWEWASGRRRACPDPPGSQSQLKDWSPIQIHLSSLASNSLSCIRGYKSDLRYAKFNFPNMTTPIYTCRCSINIPMHVRGSRNMANQTEWPKPNDNVVRWVIWYVRTDSDVRLDSCCCVCVCVCHYFGGSFVIATLTSTWGGRFYDVRRGCQCRLCSRY